MWSNLQFPANVITFTEEIHNKKLHFLCSVWAVASQVCWLWGFDGNKGKGQISKRVFQENKARQNVRKTNISLTCAYQVVRNVRFWENLACFNFLKHPFSDSPFCLITEDLLSNYIPYNIFARGPTSPRKKNKYKSTKNTLDQHLLFVNDIIDFVLVSVFLLNYRCQSICSTVCQLVKSKEFFSITAH